MKIKVMLKIKAKTRKEAKEYVTYLLNNAFHLTELQFGKDNKWQTWGFPKEFKK